MSAHSVKPGARMVSTLPLPDEPRKSKAQLARLSHFDQLAYFLWGPGSDEPTEAEQWDTLKYEDQMVGHEHEGEDILPGMRAWDDGPGDWDNDD